MATVHDKKGRLISLLAFALAAGSCTPSTSLPQHDGRSNTGAGGPANTGEGGAGTSKAARVADDGGLVGSAANEAPDAACATGGSASSDARPDADSAAAEAVAGDEADAGSSETEGAFDAACFTNPSYSVETATVVTGTIKGPGIDADLCVGGTFAYLETAATLPFLMVISDVSSIGGVHFRVPASAVAGGMISSYGVASATPGTYSSATGTCGDVSFCVWLPVPAGVDCHTGSSSCPPGCVLAGPVLGPTCMPVEPVTCYLAQSPVACGGGTQQPLGSWTLTLTSVGPFVQPQDGGPLAGRYEVHGNLSASMVSSPGASPVSLNVAF